MLKKIADRYVKLFSSLGKILLLLAFCLGTGFIIVWPLWKWATSAPVSYTIAVAAALAGIILYFLFRRLHRKTKTELVTGLLKFCILAGGIVICILLVLHGHRFLALPVVLLMIFLYGMTGNGLKRSEKK
ncbi:MAG: hypothetical protein LKF96_10620 [Treponema sp.]|nr:hypothetical protein [Treponema sp.]